MVEFEFPKAEINSEIWLILWCYDFLRTNMFSAIYVSSERQIYDPF